MERSADKMGSFRLGDWLIHPDSGEIVGPEGAGRLEAKPMAVLVELARRPGKVLSREQLIAAVWGDAFVTEEVLTHCVWELRRALGDDARKPTYLQTVPRRGYRLIASVDRVEQHTADTEGRWQIGEEIGGGAMGVVFRARDRRLERDVALKFLPREWSQDSEARRQMLREARAAAALDHPNVCPLYEIGETGGGRMFLVLALYEGETLKQRLERGPLDLDGAVNVAVQVASGLAAAHAKGIVHRDVKPSNVFLTTEGVVKLLDFGIARLPGATTLSPNLTPGTPLYMAPEQCRGDAVDARADLWALGVVLYEMLTGRRPFTGDNPQAVFYSVIERDPDPPLEALELPPAAVALLRRALAKDPADRYATASEMLDALRRLSPAASLGGSTTAPTLREPSAPGTSGGPTEAGARPPAAASPRALRRRRLRWAIGLAVVLLLLVAAGAWWSADREPLRVAVPAPEIASADTAGALAFVAAAAHSTALDELSTRRRVAPLGPEELGDQLAGSRAIARAAAADEVLRLSLREASGVGLISLQRVRGADGAILWSDSFAVPLAPEDVLLVREAVRQRLAEAFPGRDGAARAGSVSAADYLAYLELRREVEGGATDRRQLLERMQAIVDGSPRFVPGHLQIADLERSLYTTTGDREHLERALAAVARAAEIAPGDPRPPIWRTRLLLEQRRLEPARRALDEVLRSAPGHPSIPVLAAGLADLEGNPGEARRILARAVETHPSWQNLYRLARLERRDGLAGEARAHLEQALARVPGNPWVLRSLGGLELSHGRLERAEEIFVDLVGRDPSAVSPRINLGLVRFLEGRYAEAAESFREVLARHPENATAWLNLADAQHAAGDREAARAAYERVVDLLQRDGSSPVETMLEAQALARLGETREAIRRTQATVEANPEHAEVLYLSAVVYSLAGERNTAIVAAERARARGMQPIWLTIPAFAPLRDEPAFEKLLRP